MAPPDTYPVQKAMREKGMRMGPPRPQTEPAPDKWMRRLGTHFWTQVYQAIDD